MSRKTLIAAGAAIGLAAIIGGGVAIATAQGGDDDGGDVPITGDALQSAAAAALAHTGEGRVTETEVGDEDSYYEVEVTLDDGTQVDVQLDRDFHLVASSADTEDAGADD